MTKEGKGSEQLPEAICIAGPGSKVAKDLQVLVKKVAGQPEVLLIGETLEGKDIHGMMDTFVKDLFTTNCFPIHPGDSLKEPLAATTCNIGGTPCQLIFFLCRASCLQGKQKELRRVIKEVKKFVEKSPCALVGIVMDPKTSEAEAARDQLLRMLRGAFPKGSAQKQMEAEIYTPGHPRGNLAIVKAACRASEALIKSKGVRLLVLAQGSYKAAGAPPRLIARWTNGPTCHKAVSYILSAPEQRTGCMLCSLPHKAWLAPSLLGS
uniref:C2orf72-like C-terminal domain-containing protein n=1 Tax=Podarcis muralis TaxID=64176 RepID=A0A670JNX9_PODMU